MSARRAIHLYCTVIDNFGDIGVCWRLARQLAQEHDQEVHLWVDDMPAARALIARLPADGLALAEGVQLARWPTQADSDLTGDVLIEGFGCALPDATLAQLAARARKPLWIDLEYFSAEEWVPRFHLGSSIDAATRTRRWFFFPGVHAHSGGILRERGLVGARNAWQRPPGPRTHLCFGYPHAPYAEWLRALALPGAPLTLWLCGQYTQAAFPAEQRAALPAGVTVRDLPFVAQPEFDQMLWSADVLWVRGEDSMARALWSGKPFVWQIYPQRERAHHNL